MGLVAFDEVAITNGRVHLVRDGDGRMNLPEPSEAPGGEPAPLNITHLSAPQFAFDVTDATNDLAVTVPSLTLDIGRNNGRITLDVPATVRVGNTQTRVASLAGGASFDGRALKLTSVGMRSDEGSLQMDGVLSVIAEHAGMDLHLTGAAEAARVARWAMDEDEVPRGSFALDVRALGPFSGPVV